MSQLDYERSGFDPELKPATVSLGRDRSAPKRPAFDETEAMWSVAKSMDPDDVAEILGDLADASGWLDCILRNSELAWGARSRLEMLAHHARQMSDKRDREYCVLNGADR